MRISKSKKNQDKKREASKKREKSNNFFQNLFYEIVAFPIAYLSQIHIKSIPLNKKQQY